MKSRTLYLKSILILFSDLSCVHAIRLLTGSGYRLKNVQKLTLLYATIASLSFIQMAVTTHRSQGYLRVWSPMSGHETCLSATLSASKVMRYSSQSSVIYIHRTCS